VILQRLRSIRLAATQAIAVSTRTVHWTLSALCRSLRFLRSEVESVCTKVRQWAFCLCGRAVQSAADALGYRGTWILLLYVVVSVAIAIPLRRLIGAADPSLHPYLLSAQCQALATILGLVFTSTVVAAQLSSRYSIRVLEQVLSGWTLWYLVPYLVGVFLPLLLLVTKPSIGLVLLSLLLAGACVLLLAPFFFALRSRLSIDAAVEKLVAGEKRRFSALMSAGDEDEGALQEVDDGIALICGVALEALANHDYRSFRAALRGMADLGDHFARAAAPGTPSEARVNRLATELGNVARSVMMQPEAPFATVSTMVQVLKSTAARGLEWPTVSVIRALTRLMRVVEDEDLIRWIIGAAGIAGDECVAASHWRGMNAALALARDVLSHPLSHSEAVLIRLVRTVKHIGSCCLARRIESLGGRARGTARKMGRALKDVLDVALGAADLAMVHGHDEAGREIFWRLEELVDEAASAKDVSLEAHVLAAVDAFWTRNSRRASVAPRTRMQIIGLISRIATAVRAKSG